MPIFGVLQAGKSSYGGQPVWYGDPNDPKPFTIQNLATVGNIWIGTVQSVGPNNTNESTPVTPNGYLSYDGIEPVYYVIADAPNVTAVIYPGVVSVFQTSALPVSGGATLGEDPSTPAVFRANGVIGAKTGTTASFSPPGSSILVCIVNAAGTVLASSISVSDSGNHTWTRRIFQDAAGATGSSAIFTTFLSAAPGSITVTAQSSDVNGDGLQFSVRVLNGANSNQGSAATVKNSGTPSGTDEGSITTTQAGSWVYCCGQQTTNSNNASIAGTTTIDDFLNTNVNVFDVTIGRQSSPTGTPGPTTLGWTFTGSGAFVFAALEILHA